MVRTRVTDGPAGATLVVNAWASEPMRAAPSITLSVAGQRLSGPVSVAGTGHYGATFSGPALVGPGTVTISGMDAAGWTNRYSVAVSFPGTIATAGAAVTGGTYASACFQPGTFQSWYLVTAIDGRPLPAPLYAATAFWNGP
jgi:hypothetical protein